MISIEEMEKCSEVVSLMFLDNVGNMEFTPSDLFIIIDIISVQHLFLEFSLFQFGKMLGASHGDNISNTVFNAINNHFASDLNSEII